MAVRSFKPASCFFDTNVQLTNNTHNFSPERETSAMAKRDHTRDYSNEALLGVPHWTDV